MESYLNENFEVKPKHSSEEALQKWRKLCGVVKNPKRRFRFTANISKRQEAAVVRRMQQEKLRIAVLVSKAALQFIQGIAEHEYIVPEEVATAGFEICASELESIVGSRNVKRLKIHGGVEGIAKKVRSSTENGLTVTNGLENRETIYGSNKIPDGETSSFWRFAWEALQDLTLIIDAICAFISLVVGIATEGWDNRAHDALVIVASISLVVFVTAANDYWQSVKFRNWEIEKKKTLVRVTRDGFRQKLLSYELLPGDVVHLTTGDQVPADGIFVSGFPVSIDESSVTEDSKPIKVDTENPFLLSGSKVLEGSCKMMVTTVGMRTSWGKFVAADDKGGYDETPFQVKLNGLVEIIGKIGKYLALVTFSVLMKGLLTHKLQEETIWRWSGYDALEMFKYFTISFTIFGITVPEGLPLALTLNLAFSTNNMVKDNALFRHMAACETLGTATNICTDKTGIITSNQMSVLKLCFCMNVKDLSRHNNASSLCSEIPDTALRLLVQSIFVNKDSEVVNKDGKLEIWGTPTETALLEFGLSLGGNFQEQGGKLKLVKVEHFESAKKKMQVVAELPDRGFRAYCKGAPEIVLALCDKVINSNGNVVPLDEVFIAYLKSAINQFAGEGLRSLCLAYTELEDGFCTSDPIPSSGYTCIAILGIKDSIRPGIKDSVAACHAAGITVRMVTGDSIDTAKAIARECGILTEDGLAIEGADFREKNLEELLELIPKIQVIAQSSPLDKHSLVKHLQTTFNEVVAVTGAGADDALSLNEADIGLATRIHGTELSIIL
ncbi:hypothetical protein K2173_002505 [Erythroxylum novogranatense]|uniref:Calcium-transporting ATPase n=1 Tax=Erythroxylum novogranatense TaxID=1862640 RepID=A0AAV8TQR2_9ROSI|nr:hypothetical protein K2173_002505 [Erythroxylum novogranatense]